MFLKKVREIKEKEREKPEKPNIKRKNSNNKNDSDGKMNFDEFDLENFLKNESKRLKGKYGAEFVKEKSDNKTTLDTYEMEDNSAFDVRKNKYEQLNSTKKSKKTENLNDFSNYKTNHNKQSNVTNLNNSRIYNIKIDLSGFINNSKIHNSRYHPNNNQSLSPVNRSNIYSSNTGTKAKINKRNKVDGIKIDKFTGFYKEDIKYNEKKIKNSDKLFAEKIRIENKLRQNNTNMLRTYTTQFK